MIVSSTDASLLVQQDKLTTAANRHPASPQQVFLSNSFE
jgi:hypothetical protein